MNDLRNVHDRAGWFQRASWAVFGLLAVRGCALVAREAPVDRPVAGRTHAVNPARRGRIVTARGEVLAESVPGYAVSVVPRRVIGNESALREVMELARLGPASGPELRRRLLTWDATHPGRPITIRRVFADELSPHALRLAAPMRGVALRPVTLRRYPEGALTAAAVGAMGEVSAEELGGDESAGEVVAGDRRGRSGVERTWEQSLRRGATLMTTLDLGLQREAARLLGARRGAVVALDPSDGRMLVYLSAPAVDPNRYERGLDHEEYESVRLDPAAPLVDRVASVAVAPGSVFRPFFLVAASGRSEFVFEDALARGRYRYFDPLFVDVDRGVVVATERAFGFGRITGSDAQGEASGSVQPFRPEESPRGWAIENMTGYGASVTALQLGVAWSALVNGGTVYQPRFVTSVTSGGTVDPARAGPVVSGRRELSAGFRARVLDALRRTTQPGGALARLDVRDVNLGALHDFVEETTSSDDPLDRWAQPRAVIFHHHDWFVGLAPAHAPRIVVVVRVEEAEAAARIGVGIARAWQRAQEVRP
jgi:penicillin-binding protein 2